MIIPDKKKAAGMILSSRMDKYGREKTATVKPEEDISGRGGASQALAEAIIGAIQSGSASDLAEALSAFHQNMGIED